MSLKEAIKDKRPNLSASSITTYTSILSHLDNKVFGTGEIDLGKFGETDKVLDFLKDLPANKRKTILSALVIITDNKKYRDQMLDDIKDYNHEISKQEKTEEQKDSWVEGSAVKELWDKLKRNADLIYKKKHYTQNDLQEIQSFIIMSLLGGVFIAPRRAKDYCDFKIKEIDPAKDNYLRKTELVFNSYKTAKCYGEQVVRIPVQLKNILAKWIKINPTDYLLFDTNMNPLTSVKLNQRLNRLFDGKKVGVNQLRHTYLTDKYADTLQQKKAIDADMRDMGSSANMLTTYVKED